MDADGLAPGTSTTRVNNVRAILRAAVRDRVIAVDPSDGATLPRDRRRAAAMSLPTSARVGSTMTAADVPFRAFVTLAAFAGPRLGEAAAQATITLNTYGPLWPTAEDRTRTAASGLFTAATADPVTAQRRPSGSPQARACGDGAASDVEAELHDVAVPA
jgi:hypothetical protein